MFVLSYIEVIGGQKLEGSLDIQGSKNSSLPILAATVLCRGISVIHNCPVISDVTAAIEILRELGCNVTVEGNTVVVDSTYAHHYGISYELMKKMRSSIVFLGAVVSRFGHAKLCFPGGCELGPRPIDIHISSLKTLGVDITEKHGFIDCKINKALTGGSVLLPIPSVGATENIILASVVSKGITIIKNAAREPEIVDLCNFLNKSGAKISGAGESEIEIIGSDRLYGCEHSVISDRIAAATYLAAAAATGGYICLKNVDVKHLSPIIPVFSEAGCNVTTGEREISVSSNQRLRSVSNVRTMPYPGFPTDAQPLIMAMLAKSYGTTMFIETIFQSRYKHVSELAKFGADIKVEGRVAVLNGVDNLYGAIADSTDLRGGAAAVIAALSAEGKSEIRSTEHIYRGYENIEKNLSDLGAKIKAV